MNISAEKNRYLREAEVVLAREGFLTDRTHAGSLRVLLDGVPLCEVPESGVPCRMEDASTPEKVIVTTPGADNKKELRGPKRV